MCINNSPQTPSFLVWQLWQRVYNHNIIDYSFLSFCIYFIKNISLNDGSQHYGAKKPSRRRGRQAEHEINLSSHRQHLVRGLWVIAPRRLANPFIQGITNNCFAGLSILDNIHSNIVILLSNDNQVTWQKLKLNYNTVDDARNRVNLDIV